MLLLRDRRASTRSRSLWSSRKLSTFSSFFAIADLAVDTGTDGVPVDADVAVAIGTRDKGGQREKRFLFRKAELTVDLELI